MNENNPTNISDSIATQGANDTPTSPDMTGGTIDPVSDSLVTDSIVAGADSASAKSKKPKVGLIVGAAVVAAAGIGGGAFAYVHTRPENVVLGAFSNLVNADILNMSGSVKLKSDIEGVENLTLTFDQSSSTTNEVVSGTNVTVAGTLVMGEDMKSPFSVTASEAFIKDGTLYFKFNNLKQSVDSMFENMGQTMEDDSNPISQVIQDDIDNTWWKVSIDDVISIIGEDLTSQESQGIKDAYSCIVNQTLTELNKKSQYIDLFKSHQFVSLGNPADLNQAKPEGVNYYLSIHGDELTDYIVGVTKAIDFNAYKTCLRKITTFSQELVDGFSLDVSDKEIQDAKDSFKEELPKLPTIFLGVDDWGHRLNKIVVQHSDVDVNINFDYSGKQNITKPTDAKPFSELYEKITQSISTLMQGFATPVDEDFSGYYDGSSLLTELESLEDYEDYDDYDDEHYSL